MSVDLHSHSCFSDGELTPEALVDAAHAAGVEVLALTDHDTTAGIPQAAARAGAVGLELLTGIELSVSEDGGATQMHVLGYGIDPDGSELAACLEQLAQARRERAARCLEQLDELGIHLSRERVEELAGEGTIGRPHVARALVEGGHCRTFEEAFTRYLRRGRPAYVPSPGLSAGRAIALIHTAGGVASLAHPFLSSGLDRMGGIEKLVGRLVVQGLDALEVHHPRHKRSQRQRLGQIARGHGLLRTGGSDFHGESKPDIQIGSVGIERERYAELCERIRPT